MKQPAPDFAWYAAESKRLGLKSPRCPFQNVNVCPRYFYSLSLLGDHGCTKIERAEDDRLVAFWKDSPLAPKTGEQETRVTYTETKRYSYHNFCPEVAHERFRLFATGLYSYATVEDAELARGRLAKEGVPGDHSDYYWSAITPQHYAECPLYSQLSHDWPKALTRTSPASPTASTAPAVRFDVFISHASEDKDDFVRPLAAELTRLGLRVWYDEWTLKLGDSLRQKIDEGLANSEYGVVVLSRSFFAKNWPKAELDGLFAREMAGRKVILPVWHDITKGEVLQHSPMLAGKLATTTDKGVRAVALEVFSVVRPATPVPQQAVDDPKRPPKNKGESVEPITQLLRSIHALSPLLHRLDEPADGNTARIFFSALQVFFHGANLLTGDLDRDLLYATDNLLRVVYAPHDDLHYRVGKSATAVRCIERFCKRCYMTAIPDPVDGAEDLTHAFRLLHASLLDLLQVMPDTIGPDKLLLRLLTALLEYARLQTPKKPFPLPGPGLHQALRAILDHAVATHLNVRLPDPLDTLEVADMRSYCHAAWEKLETDETSP